MVSPTYQQLIKSDAPSKDVHESAATPVSNDFDSYHNGLDGKEAAWAARKYRGHQTLPPEWQDVLKLASLG